MVDDPTRRVVIGGVGIGLLAGCVSTVESIVKESEDSNRMQTEPKQGDNQQTTSPSETTVELPASCPKSPDVTGLPARPEDPNRESITAFVAEYERTLALARNTSYVGFSRFEHVETKRTDGGYAVYFYVVPLVAPKTSTTSERNQTATPTPQPTNSYNVGYFVDERRLIRDERPDAKTYQYAPYDGFDPQEGGTLIQC